MRKARTAEALALLLAVAIAWPAAAQEAASAEHAFRELNNTAIQIYQDAKHRFFSRADPVVIAGGGSVLIRHRGAERRVGQIPAEYHLLKTVGHVPRSIWAALAPAIEGDDPEDAWRAKLEQLRPRADAALRALPQTKLPPSVVNRAEQTLRRSLDLIDRYLASGMPTRDELQQEMRGFVPALLADATAAARARLDAIDRDVRPWWDALSEGEHQRTMVVVLGAKTARAGNSVYGYFVNLLGAAEDGRRVIYAESIFDEKDADALLATLLTDRRLSVDFFADERRMERDLLADGATARLLQLFGRLGAP